MFQQLIALSLIAFFASRLILQRKKNQVNKIEFYFWSVFWFLIALLIIFIKQIDLLVAKLGFSATGIDVLLYLGVAILFYLFFRLRLKLEKIDRDITKIIRAIALNQKKQ